MASTDGYFLYQQIEPFWEVDDFVGHVTENVLAIATDASQ